MGKGKEVFFSKRPGKNLYLHQRVKIILYRQYIYILIYILIYIYTIDIIYVLNIIQIHAYYDHYIDLMTVIMVIIDIIAICRCIVCIYNVQIPQPELRSSTIYGEVAEARKYVLYVCICKNIKTI